MSSDKPVIPHFRLGRHDLITIDDIAYRWVSTDDVGHVLVRDRTELFEKVTHAEFESLRRSQRLRFRKDHFRLHKAAASELALLSSLPESVQSLALWREEYCQRHLIAERNSGRLIRSDRRMKAAIATTTVQLMELHTQDGLAGSACEMRKPPKPSTLRRWISLYLLSGRDPASLIDSRKNNGPREPRTDAEVLLHAKPFIEGYASDGQPSMVLQYKLYLAHLRELNKERQVQGGSPIGLVGRKTFERHIRNLDPYFVLLGREGKEAADRAYRMNREGLDVQRPLEWVEIDEWKVSLHTILVDAGIWAKLSPELRKAVKRTRVWLSAAIDRATRCILALRFLHKAPSSESAISCIEMAIFDKSHLGGVIGTLTPWDMFGLPSTISMDSGSSFIAVETKCAIRDAGAEYHYPPSGMAEMRGFIERVFGTFQRGIIRLFPGQTFENIIKKGNYDSMGNACIDIEELNRVFIRYVVDIYHNTPHAGLLGETPRNAWLRLTQKYGVIPPPDETVRRHIFGVTLKCRITNDGVTTLGLSYQSPELQRLRRTVYNQKVLVRVDPFNLHEVSVQEGEGWIKVPLTAKNLDLTGVSYWEWQAAGRALARENADISALDEEKVFKALLDIKGTAEMARARAQLGSPVPNAAEFKKQNAKLYRNFGLKVDEPSTDLLALETPPTAHPTEHSDRNDRGPQFDEEGFLIGHDDERMTFSSGVDR